VCPLWRRHQGKTTHGCAVDHAVYPVPGRDRGATSFIASPEWMNQNWNRKKWARKLALGPCSSSNRTEHFSRDLIVPFAPFAAPRLSLRCVQLRTAIVLAPRAHFLSGYRPHHPLIARKVDDLSRMSWSLAGLSNSIHKYVHVCFTTKSAGPAESSLLAS